MVSELDSGHIGDVPDVPAGPKGGGLGGSHIDWRGKQVPTRTLGPSGVDCEIPRQLERIVKPLPSRHILKTSKESPKEKTSYLVAICKVL